MLIYIVASDHKYEGLQEILKAFSIKSDAEKFIKKYNKEHTKRLSRHEQIRKDSDEYFYKKLKEAGLKFGDIGAKNFVDTQSYRLDEEFRNGLSKEDKELFYYSWDPQIRPLIIIKKELE